MILEIMGNPSTNRVEMVAVDGEKRYPLTRVRRFTLDADAKELLTLEVYVDAIDCALELPAEIGEALVANERIRARNVELERRSLEQLAEIVKLRDELRAARVFACDTCGVEVPVTSVTCSPCTKAAKP